MKLVGIHEGPGGNAEGNIIGKGIQFHTHGACGVQGTGHPSVKASATMAMRMNTAAVLKLP